METGMVKEIFDFKKIPVPEKLLEVKVANQDIEDAIFDAREKFLTIEEVLDGIVNGDIVSVELDSGIGELGKQIIQVNVGKYVFDKAFESGIIGMKKNDVNIVEFKSGHITAKILRVKRRMMPDLTDKLVCRLGIEGVTTTEAYRNYWFEFFVQRIKGDKSMALTEYVMNQVVAKTEFPDIDVNNEAVAIALNTTRYNIRRNAENQGISFEALLLSTYRKDNAQAAMEALTDKCVNRAKRYYVAKCFAQENHVEISEEECRAVIANTAARYKIPVEELVKQMPVELELMDQYTGYYANAIKRYYSDRFQVSLVE